MPITLVILVAVFAPQGAADGAFGTQVLASDPDHVPSTKKASSAFTIKQGQLGDAGVASDDCIMLQPKAGGAAAAVANDIRLVPCLDKPAGSKFKQTDIIEAGATWTVIAAANLQYADVNVNQKYDKGDHVYLTTDPAPGLAATAGPEAWTIRVTAAGPFAAGTFVFAGEQDHSAYRTATAPLALEVVERDDKVWFFVPPGLPKASLVPLDSIRFSGSPAAPPVAPLPPIEAGRPEIEVVAISVPQAPVVGAAFQVQVEVRNVDQVAGSGLVELRMGDIVVDARGTPTLMPGETIQLVVTLPPLAGADGLVLRSGASEHVVAVRAAAAPAAVMDPDAARVVNEAAGAAPGVALVLLASLVVVAARSGGRRR